MGSVSIKHLSGGRVPGVVRKINSGLTSAIAERWAGPVLELSGKNPARIFLMSRCS
jgi:hypothetical protein